MNKEIDINESSIEEILNDYKNSIGTDEGNYATSVLSFFENIELNDESVYIFKRVFSDLYKGYYRLSDIGKYFEGEGLGYEIGSFLTFLSDFYRSLQLKREKIIREKILFGNYNGQVLMEYIQKTIEEERSGVGAAGSNKTFLESSPEKLIPSAEKFILAPKISYFNNSSFRNIREAEGEYHRLFRDYLENNPFNFINSSFNTVFKKKENIIFPSIDKDEAYFLKKNIGKSQFSVNKTINDDIYFACSRFYKDDKGSTHILTGIEQEYFWDKMNDFISKLTEYIVEESQFGSEWFEGSEIKIDDLKNFFIQQISFSYTSSGIKEEIFWRFLSNFFHVSYKEEDEDKDNINDFFDESKDFAGKIDEFLDLVLDSEEEEIKGKFLRGGEKDGRENILFGS